MKRLRQFHSNLVWPRWYQVATFFILYAMVSGCIWLTNLGPVNPAPDDNAIDVVRIRVFLLLGAAGLYGFLRVVRFHPASDVRYAEWLTMSPWTVGQPLPLGPVHPVWQDGVILGVLTVLGVWRAHMAPLLVATVFALSYLGSLTVYLVFTKTWKAVLCLAFLWPALFLPAINDPLRVGLLAVIAAVVWQGHQQSLRKFPWAGPIMVSRSIFNIEIQPVGIQPVGIFRSAENIGWPTSVLSPKADTRRISVETGISLSALLGWWTYCVLKVVELEPIPELVLVFAVLVGISRLGLYWAGVSAPFNIWGRISHGRLLVPGFDQALLTPCATVLTGVVGDMAIRHSGDWAANVTALVVGAIWLVVFLGPPRLQKWALTGQLRFRPPLATSSNKTLPRPI